MEAIAVTDLANVNGLVKFAREARNHSIKPIPGCELLINVSCYPHLKEVADNPFHLTVLAADPTGYRNLIALLGKGDCSNSMNLPIISVNQLQENHDGLIALSGCHNSVVSRMIISQRVEELFGVVSEMRDIMGEDFFFFELQRIGHPAESWINSVLSDFARQLGIPLVAANNCRFLMQEDCEAFKILSENSTHESHPDNAPVPWKNAWFKSSREMQETFNDIKDALKYSKTIADKCLNFFEFDKKCWPGTEAMRLPKPYRMLQNKIEELASKYEMGQDPAFVARRRHELKQIEESGGTEYFLIVSEIMDALEERGVVAGPSFSDCPSSLMAYILGLTGVNPIENDLFFENFINKLDVPYLTSPDIPLVLSRKGRKEFHELLKLLYSTEKLIKSASFQRLKTRECLLLSFQNSEFGEELKSRMLDAVPDTDVTFLETALEENDVLKEISDSSEESRRALRNARKLENLPTKIIHDETGLIVLPRYMEKTLPLSSAHDGRTAAGWTFKDLKSIGFLGFNIYTPAQMDLLENIVTKIRNKQPGFSFKRTPENDSQNLEALTRKYAWELLHLDESQTMPLHKSETLDLKRVAYAEALNDIDPVSKLPLAPKRFSELTNEMPAWFKNIIQYTDDVFIFREQVQRILMKIMNWDAAHAALYMKETAKDADLRNRLRTIFLKRCATKNIQNDTAAKLLSMLIVMIPFLLSEAHYLAKAKLTCRLASLSVRHPLETCAALKQEITKITPENRKKVLKNYLRQYLEINRIKFEGNPEAEGATHINDGKILFSE